MVAANAGASACVRGKVLVPSGAYEHADGRVTQTPALWFDATEVTVADYVACEQSGKCTPTTAGGRCTEWSGGGACRPINCVAWAQAKEYCGWRDMRLPSDDEWEWAARGGPKGTRYPWGDDDPRGDDLPQRLCWAEGPTTSGGPCDVGAFPAGDTPGGIHDMAGNVFEWTASDGAADDAPDNNPRLDHKHVRGGGWYWWGYPYSLRVTSHLTYAVGDTLDYVGFRCVKQADAAGDAF
jgi:formylglycine-generating enzyme required for sulfatase activity